MTNLAENSMYETEVGDETTSPSHVAIAVYPLLLLLVRGSPSARDPRSCPLLTRDTRFFFLETSGDCWTRRHCRPCSVWPGEMERRVTRRVT